MTYTLKMNIDGFELAQLIQRMAFEAERHVLLGWTSDHLKAVVRALRAFTEELPGGLNDVYVLKLNLDVEELTATYRVLQSAVMETRRDNDQRSRALRRMLRDVGDALMVAEASEANAYLQGKD